jgi:hypothetical protein
MKKTEPRDPQAAPPRRKTTVIKNAAAPKKKTAAKGGGAGPSTAAEQAADSDWIVGPYGDLMSKKDLGLLVTSRTRVS